MRARGDVKMPGSRGFLQKPRQKETVAWAVVRAIGGQDLDIF